MPFLFNLFMDLSLPFHTITPIGHMKVTVHVTDSSYLMQSMDNPWIFLYWGFPTISLISVDSYAFYFTPLSFTPYPYDQGCMHFHCDGHMLASPL